MFAIKFIFLIIFNYSFSTEVNNENLVAQRDKEISAILSFNKLSSSLIELIKCYEKNYILFNFDLIKELKAKLGSFKILVVYFDNSKQEINDFGEFPYKLILEKPVKELHITYIPTDEIKTCNDNSRKIFWSDKLYCECTKYLFLEPNVNYEIRVPIYYENYYVPQEGFAFFNESPYDFCYKILPA